MSTTTFRQHVVQGLHLVIEVVPVGVVTAKPAQIGYVVKIFVRDDRM